MKKCILIIDDKSQTAVINGIKAQFGQEFDFDFIPIRTSAAELKKENSEDLDETKLKEEIRQRIFSKHIDVALTDFDLECDEFTGLNVVHMVREMRPKLNFFIYSGNWNKVITYVVGKEHKNATIEELMSVNGIGEGLANNIYNYFHKE